MREESVAVARGLVRKCFTGLRDVGGELGE